MITIEQLLSFKAAFETSGYSSAGRLLGKDRATVREHVIALETSIGKPLFTVKGKRLEPTAIAIQLYPKAKHIAKQTADFERTALSAYDIDLTEITVLYETFVPVAFLASLEYEIGDLYPNLKIKLLHKNRSESIKALESGQAHFAIMSSRGDAFPPDAVGISYLGATQFSPYAHPNSPLFDLDEVTLLDLSENIQYVSENVDTMNLNVMKFSNYQQIVSNTDLIVSLLEKRGWGGLNRLDAAKYEQAGWIKELKVKEILQPYTMPIALFEAYAFEANETVRMIKTIIQRNAKQYLGDLEK